MIERLIILHSILMSHLQQIYSINSTRTMPLRRIKSNFYHNSLVMIMALHKNATAVTLHSSGPMHQNQDKSIN